MLNNRFHQIPIEQRKILWLLLMFHSLSMEHHKGLMNQVLSWINIENNYNLSYCLKISFRVNNHEKIIPRNDRYHKKQTKNHGGTIAPIL